MKEKLFLTADDVAMIMSISKSMSYRIIRRLNRELYQNGYVTVRGRISKKYFEEKVYGLAR